MAYYNGNKVGSVVRPPLGLIQKTATLGEPGWHFASEDNADGYSAVYLNAPTMGDLKMWVSGDSAVTSLMLGSDIDNVVANIGDLFPNLTTLLIGNDISVVGGLDTALTNASNLTYIVVPNALKNAYKAQYSGLASKFTSWAYNVEFTIPFIGDTELTIAYIQQVVAMASGDISQVTKVIVPPDFTSFETDVFNYIFVKFVNATEIEYGEAKVPAEYQEVEYIESTGTQWIDTNCAQSNNKLKYVFDIVVGNTAYQYGNVFAGSWSGSSVSMDIIYYEYGVKQLLVQYPNVSNKVIIDPYTTPTRIEGYIENNNGTISIDINGVEYSAQTANTMNSLPIYLFAQNHNGVAEQLCDGKIYSFQIYANEILARDFVPCYRIADGVIGLYDRVGNQFYTNDGTGTFLKGADIPPSSITRPALSTCTIYYDENTSHILTSAIVQNTLTRVPEFSTAEKIIVPRWFATYDTGSVESILSSFSNLIELSVGYEGGNISFTYSSANSNFPEADGVILYEPVSVSDIYTSKEFEADYKHWRIDNPSQTMAPSFAQYHTTAKIYPFVDFSFCTYMNGTFYGYSALVYIPPLDTSNVTSTRYLFQDARKVVDIPAFDFSSLNLPTYGEQYYAFGEWTMPNTTRVRFYGLITGIVMTQFTALNRTALVEVLTNLGTPVTQQTLTIGATNLAKLTADDIAIATAKNWVLA